MSARRHLCVLMAAFGLFLFEAIWGADATAHEVRPARFELTYQGDDIYHASLRQPQRDGRWLALQASLPEICEALTPPQRETSPSAITEKWRVRCVGGLEGQIIHFPGIEITLTDIFVSVETHKGEKYTGLVRADAPIFQLGANLAAGAYFLVGMEHIFSGPDHLMFVGLLLLLLGLSFKLVKAITTFTIAHSLTLGASVLLGASLPARGVETIIALSVAFLAYEVIMANRGRQSLSLRHPWVPVFAFGLLHGMGFGGALADIGLPAQERAGALFFFNIGVEAGQIVFVLAMAPLLWGAQKLGTKPFFYIANSVAYGLGGVACFWTFTRFFQL